MKLQSYPQNFSSIFAPNIYTFEEVEPTISSEIKFFVGGGRPLSARRFAGSTTIATSPESLLRRTINPLPLAPGDQCELVCPEGRSVAIYATYDGKTTPLLHFTASHKQLSEGEVMGGSTQQRQIARGEADEVALVAGEGSRVKVVAHLSDGSQATLLSESLLITGVWVARIVADDVLSRAIEPEEVEWFRLVVSVDGEDVATLHYTLAQRPRSAVRLAWLNADGYIDYHTFSSATDLRTLSSRSECKLPSGTTSLMVEGWQELCVESGYLPRVQLERLGGVAYSPRVWLVEADGSLTPHRVVANEVVDSAVVRLKVAPSLPTIYW